MAFSTSEIRDKSIPDSLKISLPRLSLRRVKAIAMGLFACIILAFLVLWQPAYIKFRALQKEKDYWVFMMDSGETKAKSYSNLSIIPTMDQLPHMIEKCHSTFETEGIAVITFNVERFGEQQETGKGMNLDYALVRLHLHGPWNGIVSSLKVLEEAQEVSIHVKEVVLVSQGGEALLQIYFYSS